MLKPIKITNPLARYPLSKRILHIENQSNEKKTKKRKIKHLNPPYLPQTYPFQTHRPPTHSHPPAPHHSSHNQDSLTNISTPCIPVAFIIIIIIIARTPTAKPDTRVLIIFFVNPNATSSPLSTPQTESQDPTNIFHPRRSDCGLHGASPHQAACQSPRSGLSFRGPGSCF